MATPEIGINARGGPELVRWVGRNIEPAGRGATLKPGLGRVDGER